MRPMLNRRGLLLVLIAGALATWAITQVSVKDLEDRYYRIFPKDYVLLVYDPSGTGSGLRNLEQAYPADKQRHDGLRIVVQPIGEVKIYESLDEVMDAFRLTANDPSSNKIFVRLAPPFRTSKKQFRADIDTQVRYKGQDRIRLLARIVPLVGADEKVRASERVTHNTANYKTFTVNELGEVVPYVFEDESAIDMDGLEQKMLDIANKRWTPCQQFEDDLTYSEQNFGGFVLRMDDQTSQLLHKCLAKVLLMHSERAP